VEYPAGITLLFNDTELEIYEGVNPFGTPATSRTVGIKGKETGGNTNIIADTAYASLDIEVVRDTVQRLEITTAPTRLEFFEGLHALTAPYTGLAIGAVWLNTRAHDNGVEALTNLVAATGAFDPGVAGAVVTDPASPTFAYTTTGAQSTTWAYGGATSPAVNLNVYAVSTVTISIDDTTLLDAVAFEASQTGASAYLSAAGNRARMSGIRLTVGYTNSAPSQIITNTVPAVMTAVYGTDLTFVVDPDNLAGATECELQATFMTVTSNTLTGVPVRQ